MVKILRDFAKEEDGLGTVEIVLLLAVLVGLALMFRTHIVKFVSNIFRKTLDTESQFNPEDIGNTDITPPATGGTQPATGGSPNNP